MPDIPIRKEMPPVKLAKEEFATRYRELFYDPAFAPLAAEIDKITDVAWDAYANSRKSPRTRKAGAGFADPDYDLSVEWIAARDAVAAAERLNKDASAPANILIINGATRSEHTCPGETSKTYRLAAIARDVIAVEPGFEIEFLDLSRTASEFGRTIHPCKTCVSTAMPLCHWPCSCYPNHSLGQIHDWMNDIYPLWTRAHGVMILCPVNWYQTPTPLKAMIDRLVCADGGNPDPTSTHGKKADEAKRLELAGWPYPRHLAGRVFSIVVHGDAEGVTPLADALSRWFENMGLIDAGYFSEVAKYIGYMEPYATSHAALDRDDAIKEEVRNAARPLSRACGCFAAASSSRPVADCAIRGRNEETKMAGERLYGSCPFHF